jgi:hypothetical protein
VPEEELSLTFSDLMAKVGYLLFYWSGPELALTEAIQSARETLGLEQRPLRGPISERLEIWSGLVTRIGWSEEHLEIAGHVCRQTLALSNHRNLIVHGLIGGSAMPEVGSASIQVEVGGYTEPTGQFSTYNLDELEHLIQAADACRRAFRRITAFNYRLEG